LIFKTTTFVKAIFEHQFCVGDLNGCPTYKYLKNFLCSKYLSTNFLIIKTWLRNKTINIPTTIINLCLASIVRLWHVIRNGFC
jgi:hypothetical protein